MNAVTFCFKWWHLPILASTHTPTADVCVLGVFQENRYITEKVTLRPRGAGSERKGARTNSALGPLRGEARVAPPPAVRGRPFFPPPSRSEIFQMETVAVRELRAPRPHQGLSAAVPPAPPADAMWM